MPSAAVATGLYHCGYMSARNVNERRIVDLSYRHSRNHFPEFYVGIES